MYINKNWHIHRKMGKKPENRRTMFEQEKYTDENGEYKNPRIAIRMNGENEIGEIRGTSKNQNLEPNMEPILNKKLEEFPDKDNIKRKFMI